MCSKSNTSSTPRRTRIGVSVDHKIVLDDDLSDILCELKKSLTSYDLVLTDTDPVREAVKSSDPDGTKVASSDRIQSDRGLLLPTAENDVPINSQNDSEDENEEFNTCSSPPVTAIEIHPSSIQEGFEAKALNHVRKYDHSSKKDIGSRVYAEYSNGQYYWGKISNRKNGREFGVSTQIRLCVEFVLKCISASSLRTFIISHYLIIFPFCQIRFCLKILHS